jgi:DNA (cytosine-5)-methyltransferase 1
MNVLDLFSGIGGFSLGLERAGMRTVAFCEIDPFCRRVLAKHWPNVPCHDDIKTFRTARGFADVVCGGFPCQPFSTASAGKRGGVGDDRYLWPEMLRVISECKPAWVIGENVAGIETMALREVVSDLEGAGYEVAPPFEIPACAVGHDHRRARFWFLAYADVRSEHGRAFDAEAQVLPRADYDAERVGTTDGIPDRMDRLRMKALGNAVVPQIPEIIGRAIMSASTAHSGR